MLLLHRRCLEQDKQGLVEVGFLIVHLGVVQTVYVKQAVAVLLTEMSLLAAAWCWLGHGLNGLKMVLH